MRGLDYYTGTIFEVKTEAGDLGAQNTIVGGGRYDRLVGSLGGKATPAIGFALGIERTLLAIPEAAESFEPGAGRVLRADGRRGALAFAMPIVHAPARRRHPRRDRAPPDEHVGAMMKRADKLRARAAVIIGSNEIASGKLTVKDLAHGTQSEVSVADLGDKDPPAAGLARLALCRSSRRR